MMLSMTSGKNKAEFSFGKKRRNIFDYLKVGVVLETALNIATIIPGMNRKQAFNKIDKMQQKIGIDALNDYIIRDSELVKYRIERTLDESVEEYERNL